MRLALGVVALAATGCFFEAGAGAYLARDDFGTRPAYSFTLAAGFYIDPGPFRLQLGGGGDIVLANADEADVIATGAGSYARADVNLRTRGRLKYRGTLAVAGGAGGIALKPPGADEYSDPEGLGGLGVYGGLTLGGYANDLGLFVSAGGNVVTARSEETGRFWAVGPQIRVTISGRLGGLGTLLRHYEPSELQGQTTRGGCYYTTRCDVNGRNCRSVYVCP